MNKWSHPKLPHSNSVEIDDAWQRLTDDFSSYPQDLLRCLHWVLPEFPEHPNPETPTATDLFSNRNARKLGKQTIRQRWSEFSHTLLQQSRLEPILQQPPPQLAPLLPAPTQAQRDELLLEPLPMDVYFDRSHLLVQSLDHFAGFAQHCLPIECISPYDSSND